jgi:hyperosmotically inducible periplasmic protein
LHRILAVINQENSVKKKPSKIIYLVSLLVLTTACAATRTQKSVGEQFDDTVTTTRVKAALIRDPVVKAFQIDVEVFRGVVQLNGFVDSAEISNQAERVTEEVSGVNDVRNNLVIREQSRSAGEVIDDSTITARVKTALARDARTNAFQVNVETREGVVLLSGFVDSSTAKEAATEVTQKVTQVARVDNQLDVKSR